MTAKRILIAFLLTGVSLFAVMFYAYFNTGDSAQPSNGATTGIAFMDVLVFVLVIGFVGLYVAYRKLAAQQLQVRTITQPPVPTVAPADGAVEESLAATLIQKLSTYEADKKYLDSADIKQLFKITDKTLYRWRKNGTIPFTNLGGKLVYPKQSVLAILQQRLDNKYDPIHLTAHQKDNR